MSETPDQTTHHARAPRWMKVLLVVSLSLNLLIVGAIGGAVLSGGGKWRGAGPGSPVAGGGGGAILRALDEEDKRGLRRAMAMALVSDRQMRRALKAEQQDLVDLLRSDDFTPAALETQLEEVQSRMVARFTLARSLLSQRLVEFDVDKREAYADRLEQLIEKRGRQQKQ